MDKIKCSGRDLSLRKSLMLYVIAYAIIALVLSVVTFSICDYATDKIKSSYPLTGEQYYLTNEQGEQLGNGTFIGDATVQMSKQDERIIALLELLPIIAVPVYSALCIMAASLLFSKMWRQVEERGRLNAAFAHDLRTPLTVLKGYNEMLQTSEHIQTKEIAATMGKHICRMETYVSSMSNLHRMEDTQPDYKPVSLQSFLSSLYESAKIVCTQNGKMLLLQNEVSEFQLSLDSSFIIQVCNNLISNAVRYARNTVTLSFSLQDNLFLLSVSDDGKGFDKNSLHNVTAPYFTEETNHSEHFGLGLYICKLLCEHHDGYLRIDDISNGAKVSAFFKSQPCR